MFPSYGVLFIIHFCSKMMIMCALEYNILQSVCNHLDAHYQKYEEYTLFVNMFGKFVHLNNMSPKALTLNMKILFFSCL